MADGLGDKCQTPHGIYGRTVFLAASATRLCPPRIAVDGRLDKAPVIEKDWRWEAQRADVTCSGPGCGTTRGTAGKFGLRR